ncbi:MAG: alpha/beta fold hydrolase [Dehalococcoidia bacterium]|nr:alpha/beta fold hydrolase [Dehalococcoidia bacterium]
MTRPVRAPCARKGYPSTRPRATVPRKGPRVKLGFAVVISERSQRQVSKFFEDRFKDGYLDVNGLRLHYTDWGGNSNKPLLLVHGLNVQLHTWDPVADAFREDYHVYCVDLRGHGESDHADDYRLKSFVSDIHEVARQLDIIPFDLVGHSLGARIGIAYAGQHADTVKRLALSDLAPEMREEAGRALKQFFANAFQTRGFDTEEEALEFYRKQHPTWKPIFHELHAKYQLRRNWANKLVFRWDPEASWVGDMFWHSGPQGTEEIEYCWDMAGKIKAPTLVMWGATSNLVDDGLVKQMLEVIPNAKEEKFNTGHYIPREAPDEFNRSLRDFLAS